MTVTTQPPAPSRGTLAKATVVALIVAGVLLVTVDNTIVNVALPTLSADLAATTSQLQWVVDGYTLAFAGLLLGVSGAFFREYRDSSVRTRRDVRTATGLPSWD